MTVKLTERVMLCRGCNRVFSGLSNFDKHRVYHPDDWAASPRPTNMRRICRDPLDVGLVVRDNGVWGGPPMEDKDRFWEDA